VRRALSRIERCRCGDMQKFPLWNLYCLATKGREQQQMHESAPKKGWSFRSGLRLHVLLQSRRRAVCSGRRAIFFINATSYNPQCIVTIPRRAHPDVALFVGRLDHRHGFAVDRLDYRVGAVVKKP
jgi:hypothetical protein